MKQPVDEFAIIQNRWYGQYLDASFQQSTAEAEVALCGQRRAAALARLRDDGWTVAAIASAAGLTKRRVSQLIRRGRARRLTW
jgi:hypothetical protein